MTALPNAGADKIKELYDYETCKEIVSNGCQSGVCTKHILYGDTIKFFEDHEAEVVTYVGDILGVETLVDIFAEHDACYDAYRNDVVWTFIELVAMDVVTEMERLEYEQEQLIESYMQPVSGYNPPGSMTVERYANVWFSHGG